MSSSSYTLLFDPECSLCARFKVSLERLDKENQITYLSIYDENLLQRFPFLAGRDFHAEVHLVNREGDVFVGGEVITELLKTFPLVQKFSWLLDSESSKKAMSIFYKSLNSFRRSRLDCPKCQKK